MQILIYGVIVMGVRVGMHAAGSLARRNRIIRKEHLMETLSYLCGTIRLITSDWLVDSTWTMWAGIHLYLNIH